MNGYKRAENRPNCTGSATPHVKSRLFGITRPVGGIGDHEGIAGCNPRRNCCCRKISNIGKRARTKVWSLRDYLVALVATLPTTVPATIGCFPNSVSVPGFAGGPGLPRFPTRV